MDTVIRKDLDLTGLQLLWKSGMAGVLLWLDKAQSAVKGDKELPRRSLVTACVE